MKKLLILSLMLSLSAPAFSSSRTDSLLQNDSETRLSKIELIQSDLQKLEAQRAAMNNALKNELKKSNNEKIFIKARNAAAIGTAVALPIGVGIATSETVMTIIGIAFNGMPSKLSVGGAAAAGIAIVGTVVMSGAEAGVLLNRNEAEKLSKNLDNLKVQIAIKNANLSNEVNLLCKSEPRHKMCY